MAQESGWNFSQDEMISSTREVANRNIIFRVQCEALSYEPFYSATYSLIIENRLYNAIKKSKNNSVTIVNGTGSSKSLSQQNCYED